MTTDKELKLPFETSKLKTYVDRLLQAVGVDLFKLIITNIESQYTNPKSIETLKTADKKVNKFKELYKDDKEKMRTYCHHEWGYEVCKAMIIEFGFEESAHKIMIFTYCCAIADAETKADRVELLKELFTKCKL